MAGGTPIVFPAIAVCDGIAMGHTGMKYSLVTRDLIADSTEAMALAHGFDATSDEVYGYDIPLDAVDTDFQLAILGTKGTWYDHTVSVRNAEPKTEDAAAETAAVPADGSYTCAVTLEGGSGRATVESPAALTVADGTMTAVIVWSSPNYDYMLIDGEKYLPTNTEGNSTFEIPVAALDTALAVTADTVAMSTPHEIDYTLTFDSATLTPAE